MFFLPDRLIKFSEVVRTPQQLLGALTGNETNDVCQLTLQSEIFPLKFHFFQNCFLAFIYTATNAAAGL